MKRPSFETRLAKMKDADLIAAGLAAFLALMIALALRVVGVIKATCC